MAVSEPIIATQPGEGSQAPTTLPENEPVSNQKSTWRGYIWDSWDRTPEERKLVLKMDLTLMTFGCLGTFIKYLDKSNLQSAFVSGMKEDLSLYGNELNYANTAYSIANIIALWPSNLILTRVNPRWFIPFLELGWTVITFLQAVMTKPSHMYALRAILAIFETGHYSAVVYLCGAWYQKRELARRLAIINITTAIGPMFSSYLQAAAYTGLNGVHGKAGWQWLFIIDGVISLGIIIPQFLFYPDVPARQKPDLVFTEREIELARNRNPKEGRVKQGAFTLAQVKRWFLTLDIWLLWIISFANAVVDQPMNSMAFWLKEWNKIKPGSYTVPQINNYTTPIQGVTVVVTLLMAWSSDTWLRGRRWPMLVVGSTVAAIVDLTLASTSVFPENRAGRWFLYYLTGFCQASNSMFWAWTQDTLVGDPATRAFASAGLNVWASLSHAVIPLAIFQTVDQPAVVAGNYGSAGFAILHSLTSLGLAYLQHTRSAKLTNEDDESEETEEASEGSANKTVAVTQREV
uniref:Major facilitator superfamily (MFS) profile domain-containing protein n=1 Tax=Bionectria ochroleuca TaxID=29856 RepID=A0A0B7K2K8_BIOOC